MTAGKQINFDGPECPLDGCFSMSKTGTTCISYIVSLTKVLDSIYCFHSILYSPTVHKLPFTVYPKVKSRFRKTKH